MPHHDDVSAGGQMVRGRYEFITCARHRVGSAFDSRGFGNGHGAAQNPWVVGYWSIELTRIEHSSKKVDGHIRQADRDQTWAEIIRGLGVATITVGPATVRGRGTLEGGGDGGFSEGNQKAN